MDKLDSFKSLLEELLRWVRLSRRITDYRIVEPIKISYKDFRLSIKLLIKTTTIQLKEFAMRLNTSLKEAKTNPYVYRRSWIDRSIDIARIILLLVSVMMAINKPRRLIVLNRFRVLN